MTSRPVSSPGFDGSNAETPGGEAIYPADWFQKPTDTLLEKHLTSHKPRSGWGAIACKTVAEHHVENCYILGEGPRGSGFGQSVLSAAPEFLVLAPRIDNAEQLGTWVSICITYVVGKAPAAIRGACGKTKGIPERPILTAACKSDDLQRFVGQKASADLGGKMLEASGAKALRWGPPRSAMTMDFRPDRLTVAYDDAMTITSARCG